MTGNTKAINMLGYDWIAAILDQSDESQITNKQEAYFTELKEFRRLHRDECQNDTVALPYELVSLYLLQCHDVTTVN